MYKDIKIAYSLRGGGAKCIGYLGVWDAFKTYGIEPDMLLVSSGAGVLSGMYVDGYSIEEIIDVWKTYNPLKFFGIKQLFKGELLSTEKSIKFAKKYTKGRDLKLLNPPVYVQCTNFVTGKSEVFEEGDAAKIFFATAITPPVYKPAEINGQKYVDGDFTSGYGYKYLKEKGADYVVGMNTSPKNFNKLKIMEKIFKYTAISVEARLKLEEQNGLVDYVIPNVSHEYSMASFGKLREMYELGYQIGIREGKKLKELLNKK